MLAAISCASLVGLLISRRFQPSITPGGARTTCSRCHLDSGRKLAVADSALRHFRAGVGHDLYILSSERLDAGEVARRHGARFDQ